MILILLAIILGVLACAAFLYEWAKSAFVAITPVALALVSASWVCFLIKVLDDMGKL